MNPCSRGEILTRSVQENAANRTAVIKTRAQVCEHLERFIDFEACGNRRNCASNFLGSARAFACCSRRLAVNYPNSTRYLAPHPPRRLARAPIAAREGACAPQKQNVNLRLSRLVRFSFANQHPDWLGRFSPPRVPGLFRPI